MRNLNDLFSMQPPTRDAMAQRLRGGPRLQRTQRSSAPTAFYALSPTTRSTLQQNSYTLGTGMGGKGLGGLAGAFAAKARSLGLGNFSGDPAIELVPGVNFKFPLDKLDFVAPGRPIHQEGIRKLGLQWTPVPLGVITAARNKLAALENSTEEGAATAAALKADGQDKALKVFNVGEAVEFEAFAFGARGEVDIFGKVIRNDVERNRLNAMRELAAWLNYVAAVPVPKVEYVPGAEGTPGAVMTAAQRAKAQAAAAAAAAAAARKASQGSTNTMLYVGGALAVGLLAVVVIKKRKG